MLKNKCILITGASSGMGQHFAEYADAQGATVVLVARREERLKEIQQGLNGKSYIFSYDLNDLNHIQEIFEYVKKQGIKLDALVHCAGTALDAPVRVADAQDTECVMRVNCLSFIQLGRFFSMKKYSQEGAAIVAISSMAVYANPRGMVAYNAAKTALNSAVSTMAKEFLSRRICVNGIAPGFVDTPMARAAFEMIEGREERVEKEQPFGMIPMEQVSYLIEFLLSDRGKYITGAVIPISGGDLEFVAC